MEHNGLALRMRWLWFIRVDDDRPWSGLGMQFSVEEHAFFFASTSMDVGMASAPCSLDQRALRRGARATPVRLHPQASPQGENSG
jgi:hypothetical protein